MAQARPPAGRGPRRPLGARRSPRRPDRRARHDPPRPTHSAANRFTRIPPPRRRALCPSHATALSPLHPADRTTAAVLTPRPAAASVRRRRGCDVRRRRLRDSEQQLNAGARPAGRAHGVAEGSRARFAACDEHHSGRRDDRHASPTSSRHNASASRSAAAAAAAARRPPARASQPPPSRLSRSARGERSCRALGHVLPGAARHQHAHRPAGGSRARSGCGALQPDTQRWRLWRHELPACPRQRPSSPLKR